jgi:hypothetical protein
MSQYIQTLGFISIPLISFFYIDKKMGYSVFRLKRSVSNYYFPSFSQSKYSDIDAVGEVQFCQIGLLTNICYPVDSCYIYSNKSKNYAKVFIDLYRKKNDAFFFDEKEYDLCEKLIS